LCNRAVAITLTWRMEARNRGSRSPGWRHARRNPFAASRLAHDVFVIARALSRRGGSNGAIRHELAAIRADFRSAKLPEIDVEFEDRATMPRDAKVAAPL
jgi:hypothetical protein